MGPLYAFLLLASLQMCLAAHPPVHSRLFAQSTIPIGQQAVTESRTTESDWCESTEVNLLRLFGSSHAIDFDSNSTVVKVLSRLRLPLRTNNVDSAEFVYAVLRGHGASSKQLHASHAGTASLLIVSPISSLFRAFHPSGTHPNVITALCLLASATARRAATPQAATPSRQELSLRHRECLAMTFVSGTMEQQSDISSTVAEWRATPSIVGGLEVLVEAGSGAHLCCHNSIAAECQVSGEVVDYLSQHWFVVHISLQRPLTLHNKFSRGLVETGRSGEEPLSADLGLTGEGMVVGVSDTGIDTDHCFFRDEANPMRFNERQTSHRKIVRYATIGQSENAKGDFSPGHGTHVVGTLVGSLPEGTDATSFPAGVGDFHGVAPKAKVSFYDLSGDSSEGIQQQSLNSMFDVMTSDGATVSSNSWGSEYASYNVNCQIIDRYVHESKRELTVLFSAGNDADRVCNTKPSYPMCDRQTVMAPSTSKNGISVGSSLGTQPSWEAADFSNYVLTVASTSYSAFVVKGVAGPHFPSHISGTLVVGKPIDGCAAFDNALELAGSIVIVNRGTCVFKDKVKRAVAASAAAVVVVNSIPGEAIIMGCEEECDVAINSFMISKLEGARLIALINSGGGARVMNGTIAVTNAPQPHKNEETLSSFSSHGPTADYRIKPDIVAVGEMLHSAKSDGVSSSENCDLWASQGTSMSTPLVAGYALKVQEYLKKIHSPSFSSPSSALTRAVLVQSARPLLDKYDRNSQGDWRAQAPSPNFESGHGTPRLSRVLSYPGNNVSSLFLDEVPIKNGETVRYCMQWSPVVVEGDPNRNLNLFEATLAWIDPPGSPLVAMQLVNNLDLVVVDLTTRRTMFGNRAEAESFGSVGDAPDTVNNLEKVRMPFADDKKARKVMIEVRGTHVATGTTSFALVAAGQRTSCDDECPKDQHGEMCAGHGRCEESVCICNDPFQGFACEVPIPTLSSGERAFFKMLPSDWAYFTVQAPAASSCAMTLRVTNWNVETDIDFIVCTQKPNHTHMSGSTPLCPVKNDELDNGAPLLRINGSSTSQPLIRSVTWNAAAGLVYYVGILGTCCFPGNVTVELFGATATEPSFKPTSPQMSSSGGAGEIRFPFNTSTTAVEVVVHDVRWSSSVLNSTELVLRYVPTASSDGVMADILNCSAITASESMDGTQSLTCETIAANFSFSECVSALHTSKNANTLVALFVSKDGLTTVPHPSVLRFQCVQSSPTSPAPSVLPSPPPTQVPLAPEILLADVTMASLAFVVNSHQCLAKSVTGCRTSKMVGIPSSCAAPAVPFGMDPPIPPTIVVALTSDTHHGKALPHARWFLDGMTEIALRPVETFAVEPISLLCSVLPDVLGFVECTVSDLIEERTYSLELSGRITNPFPPGVPGTTDAAAFFSANQTLRASVVPRPSLVSLSLQPYTHFANPLVIPFPYCDSPNVTVYMRGNHFLPIAALPLQNATSESSSSAGSVQDGDDSSWMTTLLNMSFTSQDGMSDDIVCTEARIVTDSLIQCRIDSIARFPDGATFTVWIASTYLYSGYRGIVSVVFPPRPRIDGFLVVNTSTMWSFGGSQQQHYISVNGTMGVDQTITAVGANFPLLAGSPIRCTIGPQRFALVAASQEPTLVVFALDHCSEALERDVALNAIGGVATPYSVECSVDIPPILLVTSRFQYISIRSGRLVSADSEGSGDQTTIVIPPTAPASPLIKLFGSHLNFIPVAALRVFLDTEPTAAAPMKREVCLVKPLLSALDDEESVQFITCRVSPFVGQGKWRVTVLVNADSRVGIPNDLFLESESVTSGMEALKLNIAGSPLLLGVETAVTIARAAPDALLFLTSASYSCSAAPALEQYPFQKETVSLPDDVLGGGPGTTFRLTPQVLMIEASLCFSNGTLDDPLSGAPSKDQFFSSLPVDLFPFRSVVTVTSVKIAQQSWVIEGNNLTSSFDHAAANVSVNMLDVINLTVQLSDFVAPPNVDEDVAPLYMYLGIAKSSYANINASQGWVPCDSATLIPYGQAATISKDFKTHIFDSLRIVGDIITSPDNVLEGAEWDVCVSVGLAEAANELLDKHRFQKVGSVVHSLATSRQSPTPQPSQLELCALSSDCNGGSCIEGRCVCTEHFKGVRCEHLCPLEAASGSVCSGHGSCMLISAAPNRHSPVRCVCEENYFGHGCGMFVGSVVEIENAGFTELQLSPTPTFDAATPTLLSVRSDLLPSAVALDLALRFNNSRGGNCGPSKGLIVVLQWWLDDSELPRTLFGPESQQAAVTSLFAGASTIATAVVSSPTITGPLDRALVSIAIVGTAEGTPSCKLEIAAFPRVDLETPAFSFPPTPVNNYTVFKVSKQVVCGRLGCNLLYVLVGGVVALFVFLLLAIVTKVQFGITLLEI